MDPLRAALAAGGTVAAVAGLDTVLRGARSLPGQDLANPVLESELRFYAAFYVAFGLTGLHAAAREEPGAGRTRGLAGALFLAGLARAVGWRSAGRPHPLQRVLLGLELGLPPAVVAWQRRG